MSLHASSVFRCAPALALALTLASTLTPLGAAAQKPLGSYAGTIELSGVQHGPEVTYKARAKVTMPVTERSAAAINAEFLAGEAPNASVLVTQWDTFSREKSADSGGQFNTTSCSLAAPAEIPMSATGVLNADLKAKRHAFSLTLLSLKELAFNCTHSRSGPFKKKAGIALYAGTGVPGMHYQNQLPFTDAAALAARYTLRPTAETKGQYGPIEQAWDLKLTQ